MKYDLQKQVISMTNVTTPQLSEYNKLCEDIIAEDVFNQLIRENDSITDIDIGIGKLSIQKVNDKLNFKFIPTNNLVDKIKDSMKETKLTEGILEKKIDKKILENFLSHYESLI